MDDEQVQPLDSQEEPDEAVEIPEDAFVIVDSYKVIPLTRAVVNIGRRVDNDLVLDDPRVSRKHVQLRATNGRYVIFDLDSTGGVYVNGQRVEQGVLYPGDTISLGGVSLVYGQKNPPPRPDLKETAPF